MILKTNNFVGSKMLINEKSEQAFHFINLGSDTLTYEAFTAVAVTWNSVVRA